MRWSADPHDACRQASPRRNSSPRAAPLLKINAAMADTTYMSSRRSVHEAQKLPADPHKGPERPLMHPVRVNAQVSPTGDPVRVNAHPVRVFGTSGPAS